MLRIFTYPKQTTWDMVQCCRVSSQHINRRPAWSPERKVFNIPWLPRVWDSVWQIPMKPHAGSLPWDEKSGYSKLVRLNRLNLIQNTVTWSYCWVQSWYMIYLRLCCLQYIPYRSGTLWFAECYRQLIGQIIAAWLLRQTVLNNHQ